uniref:Molybdopterin synthase sulfur carrier subunit n=1 Tax=Ascaris lumbricoides TaxID=6252 RepID=A0A0M3ICM8_ASCLU
MLVHAKLLLFGRARELAAITEKELVVPTEVSRTRLCEIIFDEVRSQFSALMLVHAKLLLFGRARELAAITEKELVVPTEVSTTRLCEIIFDETLKELSCIRDSCLLAVNQEYVNDDAFISITPNSEIAVIPPLSGG